MTNTITNLINKIEPTPIFPQAVYHPPSIWICALKHFPENFRRNDDGELVYLGYKVVVLGDDRKVKSVADKIIKRRM